MTKKKSTINEGLGRRAFVVSNYIILTFIAAIMLIPYFKAVAESLSSKVFVESGEVYLLPKGLNFNAYLTLFSNKDMLGAFYNSVFITVVGTTINLVMTSTLAYATSRKDFAWTGFVLKMVLVTMIISVPMMPNYLYIRSLDLDNTLWAVIIPGAISSYNFYVMRTFFLSIPETLIEASRIDGCSEWRILAQIVLPVALPSFVTVGLFYGVGHWNALQGPLIYLRDMSTLQMKVYSMITDSGVDAIENVNMIAASQSTRMAAIIITTFPIMMVYPFLQKYFVKGATLGSIKE